MTRTLEEVTGDLYREYTTWKLSEKDKNKLRDEFFQLAIQQNKSVPLSRKTVVEEGTEDEVRSRVEARYPQFIIESITEHDLDGYHKVILVENPEFKSFTYISEGDTPIVFQRQIVEGSPSLDDERLIEELPELWVQISEIPDRTELVSLIKSLSALTAEHIDRVLDDYYPLSKRIMVPFENLTDEDLSIIGKYIIRGKPTIKLAPPRLAKDQDLDSN